MPETNGFDNSAMLPVGTLLQDGKYRIERYLSSGGFGNTYVATNTEFEEQVVIKEFFMRGISDRNGDSVSVSVSNKTNVEQFTSQKEKFRKEARRLRKLRNPHIVAVHDLFEENGTAYYEMDLIKGESLSERMKRSGQPLGEAEVLQILDQVLDALSVVHAQGLYHLDLKPANIMVDQSGRALLIDFGASKQMSAGDGYSVSTSSALAFTPGYAPLEQTEQNMKAFGPWTDLYALGATLYKLLTGLTPPSASEILMMTTPLLFPTPVSGKTQRLIAWMMKPRLDERPQSVAAVRQFLTATQPAEEETRPVEPEPVKEETVVIEKPQHKADLKSKQQGSSQPVIPIKSSKNKWLWGIAACAVVILATAGLLLLFLGEKTSNPKISCPDGNHPHMIDLGLPSGTKWACCNIGASSPESYGDYYRWDETQPTKDGETEENSPYNYGGHGSSIAGSIFDASTVNWGNSWQMPTMAQMKELKDNCKYIWTMQNNVWGSQVIGPNGNSVFFPASGRRTVFGEMHLKGTQGFYWSASNTYGLRTAPNFWGVAVYDGAAGFSVRAVAAK